MIDFPETVGQLRKWLEGFPDGTRVVKPAPRADAPALVDMVQVELVYVSRDWAQVGTEAEDYKPKPGETAALLFS